jgi:hypothetical protein
MEENRVERCKGAAVGAAGEDCQTGTFEEMCFGFLTMTPPVPLTRCINLNDDVYKVS